MSDTIQEWMAQKAVEKLCQDLMLHSESIPQPDGSVLVHIEAMDAPSVSKVVCSDSFIRAIRRYRKPPR